MLQAIEEVLNKLNRVEARGYDNMKRLIDSMDKLSGIRDALINQMMEEAKNEQKE